MTKWDFLTVPDELLEQASIVANYLRGRGYAVKTEHHRIEFPYTPTLECKRQRTTLLVEVVSDIPVERAREWSRYGKSVSRDTRVVFAAPYKADRSGETDMELRELGLGLLVVDGSRVTEVISPQDLALNLELPELARLPISLRRDLGPAYDLVDKGEWREAFEEMCKVLEVCARRRLIQAIDSARITLLKESGGRWNLTTEQADRLTMGGLESAYAAIQNRNRADSQLGKALSAVNSDRVKLAHKKSNARAEERLRKNVGRRIWFLVGVLREAY